MTLDIDGVLNNYPKCWLDFIELKTGKAFNSLKEAKEHLGEKDYRLIKFDYRTSGYKKELPVNPLAKEFTQNLKSNGYTIVVSTSRPFKDFPKLESLTEEWLRLNQIQFDYLESKNEALLEKHPSIQFHVDDELDHALFFLRKNIDVYIVKRSDIDYGNVEMFPTLKFVADLNEVLYHISN